MEQFATTLPEDFDGTFKFTNPSDEDFVGRWGKKEYLYRASTTTPMQIWDATPLEIQSIRKKFAKELAEREFFKGKIARAMTEKPGTLNSIHQARTYSESDLKDLIQACLTPLPLAKQAVQEMQVDSLEDKLNRDEDGELVTEAISSKTSLRNKAKEM